MTHDLKYWNLCGILHQSLKGRNNTKDLLECVSLLWRNPAACSMLKGIRDMGREAPCLLEGTLSSFSVWNGAMQKNNFTPLGSQGYERSAFNLLWRNIVRAKERRRGPWWLALRGGEMWAQQGRKSQFLQEVGLRNTWGVPSSEGYDYNYYSVAFFLWT